MKVLMKQRKDSIIIVERGANLSSQVGRVLSKFDYQVNKVSVWSATGRCSRVMQQNA